MPEALIPANIVFEIPRGAEVPLEDLGKSLIALRRFFAALPSVLESLDSDLSISAFRVQIEDVKRASLINEIIIKLIWGDQQTLDADMRAMHYDLGLNNPNVRALTVAALLSLLLIFAMDWMYKRVHPSAKSEAISLQKQEHLKSVSEQLKIEPAVLEGLIEQVVKDYLLSDSAVEVARIPKRHGGGIDVGGRKISAKAVADVPSYVRTTLDEDTEFLEGVLVQVRATDIDRHRSGWRVLVPSLSAERVTMHVNADVDLEELARQSSIVGDLIVIYEDGASDKKPKRVILMGYHPVPELSEGR